MRDEGAIMELGILRLRNPIRKTNRIAPLRMTDGWRRAAERIFIILILLWSVKASATTYYVSSSTGSDVNNGNKPGAEKKDAAMSFLESALSTVDAVAAREIIDPEKFKDGISKIVDGTVECLNASTWCKQPAATSTPPSA